MNKFKELRPVILLFFLGFLGVLSTLPLISQMLALQPEKPPIPLEVIQVVALVQSAVLLFLMVWLGAVFAKKAGLTAPVIYAAAESRDFYSAFKPQIMPSIIGGVFGGVLLVAIYKVSYDYLPAEFILAAEKLTPPWYTKVLYGGITEEILMRWGLMSFFVWASYRITQPKDAAIKVHNYIVAIVLSALIFAVSHLPTAFSLAPEVTLPLVCYIIMGNACFGIIAGYLYWRRGLECAMGAHIVAHLTMILLIALLG